MSTLVCGQCGTYVDMVSICRHCRKYLCDRCGRVGCCARAPVDPEVYMIEGPLLTKADDDPADDDTALEPTVLAPPDAPDPVELDRLADDGGRVLNEDYEIGGEG